MPQFQNSNIWKNIDCFSFIVFNLINFWKTTIIPPHTYLHQAFVHCYQHPSEQVFLVNKFFLSIFTTTHTTGKKINVCMLEWFFHLWWYYILSKPYEKYENMKIKKIHPLLCQKKLPPPLLSYSSHFWLMIETNESARMFSCCRVRVLKSVSWPLTLESVPVNQLLVYACADSLLSMLGIAKNIQ